jgi:glycosyltransferase involved in cell wall biosynthesis
MKTAFVHDWLTGMRGGEKVLEAHCELYPTADLYTLLHTPGAVSEIIEDRRITTSMLQRMPRAERWYRYYLPLMPSMVESFDLREYDLVLSTSHCVAKGAIARPDALHVSYVFTPMRYIWDLAPEYFPMKRWYERALLPPMLTRLRTWDVASSARVDHFVADSAFIAKRIEKYYRRESTVIHPPVETAFFQGEHWPGEHYLMVSALVPSKRVDVAVDAFNELGRPLEVVGVGPLMDRLKKRARPNVRFRGRVDDEELRRLYLGCRALVHTAVEDCGIVPLEAAAAGRPTIALGVAGSLETVVPLERRASEAPTGLFFEAQEPAALVDAVRRFEAGGEAYEPAALRAHARRFDRAEFLAKMRALIDALLAERERAARAPAGGARGRLAEV